MGKSWDADPQMGFQLTEYRASEISLNSNESSPVKTVGIMWFATNYAFTFESQYLEGDFKFTKRNFPKRIATLFGQLVMLSL